MFAFHDQLDQNPFSLRATILGTASNLVMVGIAAFLFVAAPQANEDPPRGARNVFPS
jgi:hypothetical protein